ncbi:hypothetical protein QBC35DRAFT_27155 [Podospora australis]|uniref:C2H2-type domain-containing protein n=1 Tax=Podospora australis TaxID=1536484 RepID=A0AAN7AM88_9PEZI|nr:hypothetical protein QBC35DRAFT_27155 [Podospora australis]
MAQGFDYYPPSGAQWGDVGMWEPWPDVDVEETTLPSSSSDHTSSSSRVESSSEINQFQHTSYLMNEPDLEYYPPYTNSDASALFEQSADTHLDGSWSVLDRLAYKNLMASEREHKQMFPCLFPGCNKAFSRAADLDRHHKVVHIDEDTKRKFFCDYKKCSRHQTPFHRQDHFRDHFIQFHKEDILKRGRSLDNEWWSERNPKALYNGWWRCSKCLVVRVRIEEDGFTCPTCENACEPERRRIRETSAQVEPGVTPQPAPWLA